MTKIKKNTVQNLKALKDFTATFDGATAIITGRNNSGKSSFLKSLPDRIRGIKPDIILKAGESEGFQEIELTTGEIFRWSFDNSTAKGERLTIITKDHVGAEVKGSITKEIATKYFPPMFDVDAFLNSLPAKQKKILEQISGVDFTVINDRHKVAYDERTFANKKLAEAKINAKPVNPGVADKEIEVEPIQAEIHGMELHNHKYETAKNGADKLVKEKSASETEIKRLQTLLKTAEAELKATEKRIVEADKWLTDPANKPKCDDVSFMLNKKLQDAKDANVIIKENNEAKKAKEDLLQLDIKAKAADRDVKKIELEKVEMIKASKMPEGFGFSDDGITYNNLPFTKEQLSSSGIYIAALKLATMTLTPESVLTLHFDASFLDKNSLTEIETWAIDEGTKLFGEPIQLLIERPDFEAGDITYQIISDIQ